METLLMIISSVDLLLLFSLNAKMSNMTLIIILFINQKHYLNFITIMTYWHNAKKLQRGGPLTRYKKNLELKTHAPPCSNVY